MDQKVAKDHKVVKSSSVGIWSVACLFWFLYFIVLVYYCTWYWIWIVQLTYTYRVYEVYAGYKWCHSFKLSHYICIQHLQSHVFVFVFMNVYLCICVFAVTCICICVFTCICICVFTCICICVYKCIWYTCVLSSLCSVCWINTSTEVAFPPFI